MSKFVQKIRCLASLIPVIAVIAGQGSLLEAQRARFGDSFVIPNGQISPPLIQPADTPPAIQPVIPAPSVPPGIPQSVVPQTIAPQTVIPPLPTGPATAGQPVLIQNQGFDPFAIQPGGGAGGGLITPANPSVQPPPFIYPPPAGTLTAPGTAYQSQPASTFANSPTAWPNEAWARIKTSSVYRLLERPRWRHTYIGSSGDRYLGWNESDIAVSLAIPNFLWSTQPLRISPGFTFNFWNGPDTAVTGADLPSRTYNGYLASDFSTPWDRNFGAEVNVTVGVYSDFHETNSDSIRITGLGLGWFRLNNTNTFKLGVEYLDRVRVKLLPAVGFFIYPTPDLKLDVYFPRPRLAQRMPNLGNAEVWAYVGGEYGGGSWTIERLGGMGDQADVNDIRAYIGVEWVGPRRVTGLFEFGYVFNREIIYRSDPGTRIGISDALMVRGGVAF